MGVFPRLVRDAQVIDHQHFAVNGTIPAGYRATILITPCGGGRVRVMTPGIVTTAAMAGAVPEGKDAPAPIAFPNAARAALGVTPSMELWSANMARLGCTGGSIARFTLCVRRCAAYCRWATVADLALDGAEGWLGEQRRTGWSGRTHDQAASALRCWGKFLAERDIVPKDPFCALRGCGEAAGEGSRAGSTENARAMIVAALERSKADRRAKGNPAVFLAFLHWTGLREDKEASGVKWKDLDLSKGTLTSDPAWSKNKRRQTIALPPEAVEVLGWYRGTVAAGTGDPLFAVRMNRHTFHKLRELAGIPAEDERGRGYTFHSCRKWLASELDRTGASPGVVSAMLRHSNDLAQERYIDPDLSAQTLAVARLSRIWPDSGKKVLQTGPIPDRIDQSRSDTVMVETLPTTSDRAVRPAVSGDRDCLPATNGRTALSDLSTQVRAQYRPLESPEQSNEAFELAALEAVRSIVALRAARLGVRP